MTYRRTTLGSVESSDARVAGTAAELFALVTELSLAAWEATVRPLPSYSRAEIPFARARLGERSDRD
jgi:hypothetical protein